MSDDPWAEEVRCVEETAGQTYDGPRDRFENELAECIHNARRSWGWSSHQVPGDIEGYMSMAEFDPANFRKKETTDGR